VKAPGKGGPLFGIISNRSTSACSGLTPAELFPRVFDQNLPDQPAEDTRLPASRRRGEGDRRLRPAYCPSRCSPDALVLGALPVVERVFDLIRLDVNGSRTPPIKRRWVQRGAGTFLHGGTLARKSANRPSRMAAASAKAHLSTLWRRLRGQAREGVWEAHVPHRRLLPLWRCHGRVGRLHAALSADQTSSEA
jgi:hypothetical protein